ncbi:MAG: tetratricopeptide repeat protein [Pseudomonadota bacterium]
MIELGKSTQTPSGAAKDTSDAAFMTDVVDASMRQPVIVLLWSQADPTSLQLSRTLETEVAATNGAIALVRLDIDRNPMVIGQLQVQAFPSVIAFFQGQGVTGFQGVPGPAQIKEFVQKLAAAVGAAGAPAEGGVDLEQAIEMAEKMLEEGMADDAMQTFAAIAGEDEANPRAIAGLARALLALDRAPEARATLDKAPSLAEDPAIKAARAAIELAEGGAAAGEEAGLRTRLEGDPNDHAARLELASALIARGENATAVDELLELFRRDREWNDGAAKAKLLTLVDSLGSKDPLAASARRRLSSLIFA